jgi:hypothetical protein
VGIGHYITWASPPWASLWYCIDIQGEEHHCREEKGISRIFLGIPVNCNGFIQPGKTTRLTARSRDTLWCSVLLSPFADGANPINVMRRCETTGTRLGFISNIPVASIGVRSSSGPARDGEILVDLWPIVDITLFMLFRERVTWVPGITYWRKKKCVLKPTFRNVVLLFVRLSNQ